MTTNLNSRYTGLAPFSYQSGPLFGKSPLDRPSTTEEMAARLKERVSSILNMKDPQLLENPANDFNFVVFPQDNKVVCMGLIEVDLSEITYAVVVELISKFTIPAEGPSLLSFSIHLNSLKLLCDSLNSEEALYRAAISNQEDVSMDPKEEPFSHTPVAPTGLDPFDASFCEQQEELFSSIKNTILEILADLYGKSFLEPSDEINLYYARRGVLSICGRNGGALSPRMRYFFWDLFKETASVEFGDWKDSLDYSLNLAGLLQKTGCHLLEKMNNYLKEGADCSIQFKSCEELGLNWEDFSQNGKAPCQLIVLRKKQESQSTKIDQRNKDEDSQFKMSGPLSFVSRTDPYSNGYNESAKPSVIRAIDPSSKINIYCQMVVELKAIAEKMFLITNLLSPERRAVSAQFQKKQEEFTQFCEQNNIDLPKDENGFPQEILRIKEMARELAEEKISQNKRNLIKDFTTRGDPELETLSRTNPVEFENLYVQSIQKERLKKRVENKLEELGKLSEIDEDSLQTDYKIDLTCSKQNDQWTIGVNNAGMGYSLFSLLQNAELLTTPFDQLFRGQLSFSIDSAQLERLDKYLTDVIKWRGDFTTVLGELLVPPREGLPEFERTEQIGEYIRTASKELNEILWLPDGNRNFMSKSPDGYRHLESFGTDRRQRFPHRFIPVLFLDQLAIDLSRHPERDFLKQAIEQMYKDAGFIAHNGEPKTFIRGTHCSILAKNQLEELGPHMRRLLLLQTRLKSLTGAPSLKQALDEKGGMSNAIRLMREIVTQRFLDMANGYVTKVPPPVKYHHVDLWTELYQSDIRENGNTLGAVEEINWNYFEQWVDGLTVPVLKSTEKRWSPSEEQKSSFYAPHRRFISNNSSDFVNLNLQRLFQRLEATDLFIKVLEKNPGFSEGLQSLKEECFFRQINASHRQMISLAFEHLEAFVMKIFYADESGVTEKSFEDSFVALVGAFATYTDQTGEVRSDMREGCATGFAGRIVEITAQLNSNTGQSLEDVIDRLKRDLLDQIFVEQSIQNTNSYEAKENSMTRLCLDDLSEFIGIKPSSSVPVRYDRLGPVHKKFLFCFSKWYTSSTVYLHARHFFTDEFWRLSQEGDDEGMYNLFRCLGFEEEKKDGPREEYESAIDQKYRIGGTAEGRFQYAYFNDDLPERLVLYLIKKGLLMLKDRATTYPNFSQNGEMFQVETEGQIEPRTGSSNSTVVQATDLRYEGSFSSANPSSSKPFQSEGQVSGLNAAEFYNPKKI